MNKSRGLVIAATAALVMLLTASVLAACGGSESEAAGPASPSADVVAAVKGDAQLSQFAQAFGSAGLDGKGPYTVFAPSNDAMSKVGTTLTSDAVKAAVIDGAQLAKSDLAKGTKNDSMLADNTIVTYTGSDGSLYVNTYKVIGAPITSGNGIVYVIDGVIEPK